MYEYLNKLAAEMAETLEIEIRPLPQGTPEEMQAAELFAAAAHEATDHEKGKGKWYDLVDGCSYAYENAPDYLLNIAEQYAITE